MSTLRSLAAALCMSAAVLAAACAPGHGLCAICQREIHSEVHASLVLDDGRSLKTCCPRCALEYVRQQGARARSLMVADHGSGRLVPMESAHLVEGSDETPCLRHEPAVAEGKTPLHLCYDRCQPSLIAFEDAGAAREFTRRHGGRVHPPGTHPLGALVTPGAVAR